MHIVKPYSLLRKVERVLYVISMIVAIIAIAFVIQTLVTGIWRTGEMLSAKTLLAIGYIQLFALPSWILAMASIGLLRIFTPKSIRSLCSKFYESERGFLTASQKILTVCKKHNIPAKPFRFVSRFSLTANVDVTFDIVLEGHSLNVRFNIICLPEDELRVTRFMDYISMVKKYPLKKLPFTITVAPHDSELWIHPSD